MLPSPVNCLGYVLLIFLDTEYTGLGQPDPKLISIALVPEDGKNQFYAEIEMRDGWARQDCNDFVLAKVLPILKGGEYQVTRAKLKDRLLGWMALMPRYVQVACDSDTDLRFLQQILGDDWPGKLDKRYFDLRPLIDTTVYDQTVQRYYSPDRQPHNALNDAQAYRLGWLAWMDARKSSGFECQ